MSLTAPSAVSSGSGSGTDSGSAPARPARFPVYDFSGFEAAVSSSFVPLRVSAERRESFHGMLRTTEVERLAFAEIGANAHEVHRSPELISKGGNDYFKLSIMLGGTSLLVQDGREVALRAGDIAIYDTGRPYSLIFDDDFRNLVVLIPKDVLDLPQELVAEITASRLPRDTPMGTIVAQTLPHVPGAIAGSPAILQHQLARTTVELISALLTSTLGADRIEQSPRHVMVRRIRDYIVDHLQDPELGPTSIAAAHFISTRRMHGMFQGEDTTIAAFIREQRLEKCRVDLLNPAFADRPVSAIAARWGFTDAAHFSRTFKAQYGVSPREVRNSR